MISIIFKSNYTWLYFGVTISDMVSTLVLYIQLSLIGHPPFGFCLISHALVLLNYFYSVLDYKLIHQLYKIILILEIHSVISSPGYIQKTLCLSDCSKLDVVICTTVQKYHIQ